MTLFRHLALAAIALTLAACEKPAPAAAPAPAPAPAPATPATDTTPDVGLAAEGLQLVSGGGATALVPFDGSQESTIKSLSWALGGPPGAITTNEECGAGPIQFAEWPNGLQALFQEGKFVGWALGHGDTEKITTISGIGIGSTREQLLSAYAGATIEEGSLGQQFAAGELYGILDGKAPTSKIDAIWAGTSCNFG